MEGEADRMQTSDSSKIQLHETTSPSQLNEASTCPDFTFSNSLRSPEGPMRGRSVKEFEEQLGALKKENFNLKLRIYFLEERMGANFTLDKENIVKNNVELMVEIESLKKELQEKHELLCQAVKAMDLEEDEFKKIAQAKNVEIMTLKQEVEELQIQLQDGKYENDNDSSHRSYHSEPIFFSSQISSLPESSSRTKMFQDRIAFLENELLKEKENSASLQIILDQADTINKKYEQLQEESGKKDEMITNLREELDNAKNKITTLSLQIKDLEKFEAHSKDEIQRLTKFLAEKSKAVEELKEYIAEASRKHGNLKAEFDKEKQKYDKYKFVSNMKVTEMEEEIEKHKGRVLDLQKKLGSAHQDLKENQNLLVPKSLKRSIIVTNTDCDNVSVSNAAASLGIQKKDALCNALACKSPPKSPVSPKSFDFNTISGILNTIVFPNKPQVMKQLDQLKDALSMSEQRIIHLKAQELKACAIIKSLMQYRKTSEHEAENSKKRIAQLEKAVASEGVASKFQKMDSLVNDQEKPEDNKIHAEHAVLSNELEDKIKVLHITLKEKDLHMEYIESQNSELLNKVKNLEADIIDMERNMLDEDEHKKEITDNMYSKLFDEKNKEIAKLKEEIKKRTHNLQTIVNNELWQKNKEIEKLHIKYAQLLNAKEMDMINLKQSFSNLSSNLDQLKTENEEKHIENSNLKIDISDLKLQLQLLRDKIGEIGLISDDKLEVEIIISSLDNVKTIRTQFDEIKNERDILKTKIQEMVNSVRIDGDLIINAEQEKELESFKMQLKISEALRKQSTEACQILRAQLEELALFLDSLMKQKSVLGFLGNTQNKKLRDAIDHSLDLSKSVNMSLSLNPDHTLMQLSNISALLNCSDLSNNTEIDNSNVCSFSIIPDRANLTYQNRVSNVAENSAEPNQPYVVKSLEDQIQMLRQEIAMKNSELNKFRREMKNGKDLRSHARPRLSPSKLKNVSVTRNHNVDSESETWSEPDVNVSKARIGLFRENSVSGIDEIQSSDSTDESLKNLNQRRSEILNECQSTITKLNKQVQDLHSKLQQKELTCLEVQETNDLKVTFLREENDSLKIQLEEAKAELIKIENQKDEIENELKLSRLNIGNLKEAEQDWMEKYNLKDKEMFNKINQWKFERDQLVSMAKEYANMTENSRQEIMLLENKIAQLTLEKENIQLKIKKEFEKDMNEKIRNVEKEFTERLFVIETNASKEIEKFNQKL
ncbi:hypothetical protein HHI36_004810 [Cryptolaemus montrouzieri]|uniref:Centrosomin N-terminal motif 1 domain-containing protein n=1 Tax=Cryptolaemus montrouzieri TaxID=559131 RepID=A0ABD2NSP6_9CUCU